MNIEEENPRSEEPARVGFVHARVAPPASAGALREGIEQRGERLRALVHATSEIVWTTLPDGEFVEEQRAWQDFTGQTWDEARGGGWLDAVHPHDRFKCETLWRAAVESQGEYSVECRLRRRDGTDRVMQSHAVPVFGGEGELRGFIGVHRDVTEPRRLHQELTRLLGREQDARAQAERSEAAYRFLAQTIPQIVFSASADGELDYFNHRWFEFTGLTYEGSRGDGWMLSVHPRDRDAVRRRWAAAVTGGGSFEAQAQLLRGLDGTARWHLIRALPLRDGDRVIKWFGTCTDIEDQKRAEEGQRVLAEAQIALASSADVTAMLHGVLRSAVPRMAEWAFFDVLEPDGSGKRAAVAHADPRRAELARRLERYSALDNPGSPPAIAVRNGRSFVINDVTDGIFRASAANDEQLAVMREIGGRSFIVVPLAVRGTSLGSLTVVSSDAGHRYGPADLGIAEELGRRTALALDNARLLAASERERERAEQANRAKDEFLATISHELRTPLTAILGWSRMLMTRRLEEAGLQRGIEIIERNARAQARLVEDILDVSRIITGKLQIASMRVDVAGVLSAALDTIRPAADAKRVRLEAEIDADVGVVVGDADRIQQVVWNLLSNAVKFTPVDGWISVSATRADGHVEFVVRDGGVGIAPAFLPYVFDRFRQADASTTRVYGGIGLGLAIVRHIVELHGGTVHAESSGVGHGALFRVRLPIRAALPQHQPTPPAGMRPSSPIAAPRPLGGVRVLLVDDEEDARELLAMLLEQVGAEPLVAGSAGDALDALARLRPDVVVSDVGMPGEDGYSLIRRIRQLRDPELRAIPAVALTAYARAEDRHRAIAAGFHMHVAKPIDPGELICAVARLLGRLPTS